MIQRQQLLMARSLLDIRFFNFMKKELKKNIHSDKAEDIKLIRKEIKKEEKKLTKKVKK